MKEYEIYIPLSYNNGSSVEPKKIERIGEQLLEHFDGLTYFPQRNQGVWKMGPVTFRDEIVIFRVLTDKVRAANRFLKQFKEELKRDLKQEEILIVAKDAETL